MSKISRAQLNYQRDRFITQWKLDPTAAKQLKSLILLYMKLERANARSDLAAVEHVKNERPNGTRLEGPDVHQALDAAVDRSCSHG